MGRTSRVICVSIPLLTTAAAIILIVISTFIGQTNSGNSFENSLFFIRLDTRYINAPNELINLPGPLNTLVGDAGVNLSIQNTANLVGVADFYQAGLFSYCSGKYDNATGNWNVQNCSSPSGSFVFNIIDIINEQANDGKNLTFPSEINDFFKAVAALTHAQYACFIVGIIATGVEFLLGFFGLLSRWGSCVTTLVAIVGFLALLSASVINIVLYATLAKTFSATYNTFGVNGSVNTHVYALMFIGVLLSFAALLFWTFSTCCCSGRRDRVMKDSRGPPKAYERVTSPYVGQDQGPAPPPGGFTPVSGFPQQYGYTKETAYEPMRHTAV